jgi:glycine dehydrogenase subunit 1
MLETLGMASLDELFADVPKKARMGRLGIGAGKSEIEVVETIDRLLERNRPLTQFASFLGGRLVHRYVPAAVDSVLSRSEFYSAYTPYQPEASQGMLRALFEFQSLWVEMTGLDVANASLYDGATAAGEALLFCRRLHEGHRFLVPASLPWEEKSVLRNYATGPNLRVEEIPYDPRTGNLDLDVLRREIGTGDVFGVLADMPNGFGHLDEGLLEIKSLIGGVPFVVAADPLSLSTLTPPGEYGADVVVGEGQGFGMYPSFGGPLLGLFACRKEHVRSSPGRIVGATVDAEGQRAYALTLVTREQHIRRSRATSNICTNESLLALAFVVYASSVGPRGLARLQATLAEQSHALALALGGIDGLQAPRFDAPYLGEFTLEVTRGTAEQFLDRLEDQRVLGGHRLSDPRLEAGTQPERVLVAATEWTDAASIRKYGRAARSALSPEGTPA